MSMVAVSTVLNPAKAFPANWMSASTTPSKISKITRTESSIAVMMSYIATSAKFFGLLKIDCRLPAVSIG
jgi:hypothetical protein